MSTLQTATTAEQFDAIADSCEARNARRAAEQMDDAFVSEFCDGLTGRAARTNARIQREDAGLGLFTRRVLIDAETQQPLTLVNSFTGETEQAKIIPTKFGQSWIYTVGGETRFAPVSPARASTHAKRGVAEIEISEVAQAKAVVDAPAGSRGLSGLASCYVRVIRTDLRRGLANQWGYAGSPVSS